MVLHDGALCPDLAQIRQTDPSDLGSPPDGKGLLVRDSSP